MVTNLQFAGVAAYLLWCLFSSLSGALGSDGGGDDDEPNIRKRQKDNSRVALGAPWGCGGRKGVR